MGVRIETMSETSETTAAKGEIADPAKIKEAAAAKESEKDAEKEKISSPNGKGDASSSTNGGGKSADSNGKKDDTNGKKTEEPPVAGSSKSPSKKDLDIVTRAMGYFAAGTRDLLIRDPASAVASLAQACQLLGEHYGETAPECGEPYYYYGRALLDLARMEAGVIDNVLDGVPSEDGSAAEDSMVGDPEKCTDEEKEKVEKDVDEALQENYESLEKIKAEKEAKEQSGDKKEDKTEESNGDKAEDKTDGNCTSKKGKTSPAPKDTKDSPAAKDEDTKTSPAKDKDTKDSPAAKDKETKTSPAKDKETKTSPTKNKDTKTSPGKDKETKTSPASKDKETKSSSPSKDKETNSSP